MKLLAAILLIALAAILAKSLFFSFRAQTPADYAASGPEFSLKTHLSGEILSEGLIFGPDGRMTNSFTARMHGEWEGNTGTLSEEFTYSNGRNQSRKWFLTLGEGNSFTATAEDIVGEAQGVVSGSTVRMEYEIILPEESGGHRLKATDWLYLTQSGVILNKSEMRKFGVKAAELIATMRPADR
ncbi:DUF3833 domain-containing protein [Leisingera aquaemixtae]|uniref:DUF3833 family protein n=1 Tax=Leisingera TaxID=191028 RepID=UPI001C9476BA|nr:MULTISPECIES: DUF3833 family protein [Leisingera]MBY6066673.1 DUF3833 domain-containing protein [Leisingera aquaemixtae]MCB4455712.1 DUF3833 domain-containing protein [Leisingera sp. McT4-56]